MTLGRGSVSELCYAAEGMSGTAAASSLRKLGSLASSAPTGRLFGAISTLSDMSAKATKALEDGSRALDAGDDHKAAVKLARAVTHMDDMATAATGTAAADGTPAFLRKAR
ncbi:hypothetical protein [Aestuariivirga sp.]|uniref:hypothetical protein n=1 Tax=Aestuariivirga sp. TaxID=2650926 RepID=UPI0035932776